VLVRGISDSVLRLMGKPKMRAGKRRKPHRHDRASREPGLLATVWNTLSSMRLAVFVLIIFALASLLGALLPQQGMSGPPSDQGIRAVYLQKYGSGPGKLMLGLSMHNLYGSMWYVALVVLLCLSTLACGCKATQRAARRMRLPSGEVTHETVTSMRRHREATSPMRVDKALERSSAALRRLGYAVRQERGDDGSGWVVGRKFRWAVWASPMLHFSLLLIVVGGVVGLLPGVGFRSQLRLVEGETYDGNAPPPLPPHAQAAGATRARFDLALTLRSFNMTYYPDGAVKEYESEVVVTRDGERMAEKRIRVNRPLSVAGVSLCQSSWDLGSVVVSVRAPDGTEDLLEFPLWPTEDAMGRRAWFVPMDPLDDALEEVAATGWTVFCHGFWHDHAVMRGADAMHGAEAHSGDIQVNRTEYPRNPAVHLYLYPDFEGDKQRHESLGIVTTEQAASYEGHTFRARGGKKVSILSVRKDPGVPLLYAGFLGVTLGMMAALYLAPRAVRVHARRERGTTHAAVGSAGSSGSFEREFAAVAKALDADA